MTHQICLSGDTALSQWRSIRRQVGVANSPQEHDTRTTPLLVRLLQEEQDDLDLSSMPPVSGETAPPAAILASDVCKARRAGLLHPGLNMEFLVSKPAARRYVAGSACRVWGLPLPAGSFCSLGKSLLLPRPELTLLLCAAKVPVDKTALLVAEFCGYYTPDSTDGKGFVATPALSSISVIDDYLQELLSLCEEQNRVTPRGCRRLQKAARLAADRLASPAEAATFMLLTMPCSQGGYGLERPVPNMVLDCGETCYFGDLVWPDQHVVLEYQGAVHDGQAQAARDRRKSNALQAAGYTLLQAGRETLGSLTKCDELASGLAGLLGARLPKAAESFRKRQISLRQALLTS